MTISVLQGFKTTFETYGVTITADLAGVSREYCSRYAAKQGWTSPSTTQVRGNVIRLIINQ